MPTITLETYLNAPAGICFDLMRDVRIHTDPTTHKNDKSIIRLLKSEFGVGQLVIFEQKYFGMRQRLTVEVVEFEWPKYFVDEMVDGWFRSFKHMHEFTKQNGGTLIRDTIVWTSPFWVLGKVVDKLLLERHLKNTVTTRNARLKTITESV